MRGQESLPFHDPVFRPIPQRFIEAGKRGLPKARAMLAKASDKENI